MLHFLDCLLMIFAQPISNLDVAQTMIPLLRIRLEGKTCTMPAPGRECMKIHLPARTQIPKDEESITTDDEDKDSELEIMMESAQVDDNATDDEDGPS